MFVKKKDLNGNIILTNIDESTLDVTITGKALEKPYEVIASPTPKSFGIPKADENGIIALTWFGSVDLLGNDKNYTHTQIASSATWVIVHNLNKYPSVSVVDSGGTVVVGGIVYDSINQVTLTFSAAFSGKAYLN